MKTPKTAYLIFLSLLLFVIALTAVMVTTSPVKIVESIGSHNSYAVIFLIALIGGISSLTSASFYASVITLALAGLNIFLLALVSSVALTIGDCLFFYLGYSGKHLVSEKWTNKLKKVSAWLHSKPPALVSFLIFGYTGFTPLSMDVVTGSLGLIGFSIKRLIAPLFFGHLVFITLICLAARYGWKVFNLQGIFG